MANFGGAIAFYLESLLGPSTIKFISLRTTLLYAIDHFDVSRTVQNVGYEWMIAHNQISWQKLSWFDAPYVDFGKKLLLSQKFPNVQKILGKCPKIGNS